ncbi:hypothetical protein CAEBREN_11199 [Caenorhabditis brenneri]|uniref:Uncharacterized protein n=1 Tax=Caenorhabditis brenneri TaxID=135651 RepID=G0NV58_CAEBE|nr:hypothetical protein CAEBREN_11199 [Caenorhabditis brenneri]
MKKIFFSETSRNLHIHNKTMIIIFRVHTFRQGCQTAGRGRPRPTAFCYKSAADKKFRAVFLPKFITFRALQGRLLHRKDPTARKRDIKTAAARFDSPAFRNKISKIHLFFEKVKKIVPCFKNFQKNKNLFI